MNTEVETKQYCVVLKVWTWAENAKHAEDVAQEEMTYLAKCDNPIAGFAVVESYEDGEA